MTKEELMEKDSFLYLLCLVCSCMLWSGTSWHGSSTGGQEHGVAATLDSPVHQWDNSITYDELP